MLAFNPIILNCFKSILILSLRKYLQFHIHYFECLSIPGPYSMAYATCPVTSYYGGNGSRKFKWFVQSHQKPRSEPVSVFLPQHPSAFFTFMGGLNFFGKNNVGGKKLFKAKSSERDGWSTQSNGANIHWALTVYRHPDKCCTGSQACKAWGMTLN